MKWDEDTLLAALESLRQRCGDSTSIEVKRASGGLPDSTVESLCAFANMPAGGTIILGVDEARDFALVGVDNPSIFEQGLADQARTAVQPSPYVDIETLTIEGKSLVIAEVAPLPLTERPARARGKSYLRQADGDYAMQPHELRMIEVEKLHSDQSVQYDKTRVTGQTKDDLVPELLADYLKKTRQTNERLRDDDDDTILRLTGAALEDGTLTLAGLYAMGNYPQGEYPALTVTAAVQLPSDGSGSRNRNLRDFTGPIPVLLESIMDWVEQNLGTVRQYAENGHMYERPELPLNAVREIVANALVHRNLGPDTLGAGKSIQVRLTPRGLFVLSPGGLKNVAVEQLRSEDHAQAAVNQRLYTIAKKQRTSDGGSVVEGEGGGMREVFRSTQAAGLPTPVLNDTGVQFKVTLWRRQERTQAVTPGRPESAATERETPKTGHSDAGVDPATEKKGVTTLHEPIILQALRAEGSLSFKELQKQTGLTEGPLRYALKILVRSGAVAMDGGRGRRATRYELGALSAG